MRNEKRQVILKIARDAWALDGESRSQFLAQACGDNATLREEVDVSLSCLGVEGLGKVPIMPCGRYPRGGI